VKKAAFTQEEIFEEEIFEDEEDGRARGCFFTRTKRNSNFFTPSKVPSLLSRTREPDRTE
jgi:hypothetical protein|tara:strand:- start:2249 stop:2428 length:180 start_codon:yes stop_codon:yes gene_type:complete